MLVKHACSRSIKITQYIKPGTVILHNSAFTLQAEDRFLEASHCFNDIVVIFPIACHAFTGGESVVDYLDAFDVDLFLATQAKDAQKVIDGGNCAAAIVNSCQAALSAMASANINVRIKGELQLYLQQQVGEHGLYRKCQ